MSETKTQARKAAGSAQADTMESIIESVRKAVPKRIPDGDRQAFDPFLELYFRGGSYNDLKKLDKEDLAGAALAHWQQLQQRKPGQMLLDVYNPAVEEHGWQSKHTVVQLVTDDQSHLISSLQSALAREGHATHLLLHPILAVERDGSGNCQAISAASTDGGASGGKESLIRIEIDRLKAAALDEARTRLLAMFEVLAVIRRDRDAMNSRLRALAESATAPEQSTFLDWLDERQFACFGIAGFRIDNGTTLAHSPEDPLGVFNTDSATGGWPIDTLIADDALEAVAGLDDEVVLSRGVRVSPIIRNEAVNLILLLERDDKGTLIALTCITGLFVPGLQHEAISTVPWLRERVQRVIEDADVAADSHNGKALASTLRGFPRDMLAQMRLDELREMTFGIIALHGREHIRLFSSTDFLGNFCNCLVYIPRDTYSRELRIEIEQILLSRIQGESAEFNMNFSSDSTLARLHFVVKKNPPLNRVIDWNAIEERICEAAITWSDRLLQTLTEKHDEATALDLHRRYADGFASNYRDDYSARVAATDIGFMENHLPDKAPVMAFYRQTRSGNSAINFKLFSANMPVFLSDVIPIIENLGLRIEAEHPFEVQRSDGSSVWIHEFMVKRTGKESLDPKTAAHRIQEAFSRIWEGRVENDGFNRLILDAGLTWQQIVMLRSYCKYLLQIKVAFSQAYMVDSLVTNQGITAKLVELFEARFSPTGGTTDTDAIEADIRDALNDVSSLDEDRILRSYMNLIRSTLRTNYYCEDTEGHGLSYLSYKLDSSAITDLPLPRPMVEIFVYSSRLEGIHLRGGKVARGGLRWSDRREDFRTEVLGLMKAQMVKNAVIVPVGSKGGFYVKAALPAEREEAMKIVVACYQTFLRGLLDVTDNIVDGAVVPPPKVVRHDDDDPYLVVAADKGTATFSDIANGVSAEYGFWLGDAFASGGSVGYDHKKMGITARGAWESVKRHFRELGHDTQTTPFTVAGVGDMAGDVFGNGMLLSQQIRLVAAFNHMHIFLDPNPDPATTFTERQRLFELPRSGWNDYDKSLISEGGNIFSRQDKRIELTPQVQEALGTQESSCTPVELINIILKAPVDLLWNGGIGTYVKASAESHADAADRANDSVRVNGRDLRCRVVGEGGNLGFTQLGRIEYAHKGGHIYTDAIDNSAGVDCSDHEVNIKILLNAVVAADDMTLKQRDTLLETMTDDVSTLVLGDNYLQTQCIEQTHAGAKQALEEQSRFMSHLESVGRLNRSIEFLPDGEEIADMLAAERGLTRPQLAVLVSYSKMVMYDDLLATDFTSEPALERVLVDYFPGKLGKEHGQSILDHRLRNEIIATQVTNEFVNRLGPTFVFRMQTELGATVNEMAVAFMAVRSIFRLPKLWRDMESLDNKITAEIQTQMQILVRGLVERSTHWILRLNRDEEGIDSLIERFEAPIATLVDAMPDCIAAPNRETLEQRKRFFMDAGVPEATALTVAEVVPLSSSLDIVETASMVDQPVPDMAALYFELGHDLNLLWLRDRIGELKVGSQWHTLAKSELRSDLHQQQRQLCAEVARCTDTSSGPAERVESWRETSSASVTKYINLMTDMRAASSVDFAMLSLAVNEVHKLSQGQ